MKKIVVNVTAKDIREGKQHECDSCPVARAISRKLNRSVRVLITAFRYFQSPRRGWSDLLPLPSKAEFFIAAFDGYKPVRPFRFTLNVPSR